MRHKIGAAAFAMSFTACPAFAGNYTYTQIQIGSNAFACAASINGADNVIGEYYGAGSAPFGAYLYYPGSGKQLLFNPPRNTGVLFPCSYVFGISAIGGKNLAVATYADSVHHSFGPFTWNPRSGKTRKAPTLYRISVPTAVNRSGVVVGTGDKNFPLQGHGFMISGGTAQQFDAPGATSTVPTDIADDGTIVGYYAASGTHGFVRTPGGAYTTVDVPQSTDTEILSINDAGQLAGKYYDSTTEHYRGFTKSGATIVTYQYPGAGTTEVLRVLTNGLLIGNYEDANSVFHGFSYLPNSYTTLTPPDGATLQVRAVNNLGNFVGNTGGSTNGTAYVAICPKGGGVCLH